jgi:hypothetical protein
VSITPSKRLVVGAGVVATVAIVASVFTSRTARPTGEPLRTRPSKVLIFGIPQLGLGDVQPDTMPNLSRLAASGATAASNVRTGSRAPSASEAYATLGAGTRVRIGSLGTEAYDAAESYEGGPAGQALARRTATPLDGAAVVVPGMPALVEKAAGQDDEGGALGAALHAAGLRTGAVGNADSRTLDNVYTRVAPVATVVATPDGRVDAGDVSRDTVHADRAAPYGLTTDAAAFTAAVRRTLAQADVVVADPGETLRANAYLLSQTPREASASRKAALARTDALLGDVARHLPATTLLLVVGITPPKSGWPLAPIVAHGAGVERGQLVSPSTHQRGLVTLTDIAPTVLAALGAKQPEAMVGSALRYGGGEPGFTAARQLSDVLATRTATAEPMTVVFVVVQAVVYLAAAAALLFLGGSERLGRAFMIGALLCAAWPLATYWLRVWPAAVSRGATSSVLAWALAGLIAFGASRLRRHPLDPLLAICGATIATFLLDLATGSHLQLGSFFGYAPNTATRYTGLGNAGYALLGGATVVGCAALLDRAASRRAEAWMSAALVCVLVVVADGASWLGTDVGGILTLIPVLSLLLWVLSGRQLRRRTVGVAVGTAALALGLVVGVEALRPADQRTHIGRFFLGAGHGNGQMVVATLQEKWRMNVAGSFNAWAWVIPAMAAFAFYVLVVAKGWRPLLPEGSPRRAGIVAAIALAVFGWLSNDSGIVVAALVLVYTGPFLLLLALDRPDALVTAQLAPNREVPA